MSDLLKQLLKSPNFSEKEIKVYLAILELGQAKAHAIARKTDINRTTTDDILESLQDKDIISKYKKGGAPFF